VRHCSWDAFTANVAQRMQLLTHQTAHG
jgi:hypothetical protein